MGSLGEGRGMEDRVGDRVVPCFILCRLYSHSQ